MSTSTVFGIRHTADLDGEWGEWLTDSVALINDEVAKGGEAFLFDTVDVAQGVLNGRKCWDMYGWLVSLRELPSVEPLWLADKDGDIAAPYVLAEFAEGEASPLVRIDMG